MHGTTDVTALRGRALRGWRTRCAMIFQQFQLVPRLDGLTNVLLGRLNHRSARIRRRLIGAYTATTPLSSASSENAAAISALV